jgi:hypothetical protein
MQMNMQASTNKCYVKVEKSDCSYFSFSYQAMYICTYIYTYIGRYSGLSENGSLNDFKVRNFHVRNFHVRNFHIRNLRPIPEPASRASVGN